MTAVLPEPETAARQAMSSQAETPNKDYYIGVSACEYTSAPAPLAAQPVEQQHEHLRAAVHAEAHLLGGCLRDGWTGASSQRERERGRRRQEIGATLKSIQEGPSGTRTISIHRPTAPSIIPFDDGAAPHIHNTQTPHQPRTHRSHGSAAASFSGWPSQV